MSFRNTAIALAAVLPMKVATANTIIKKTTTDAHITQNNLFYLNKQGQVDVNDKGSCEFTEGSGKALTLSHGGYDLTFATKTGSATYDFRQNGAPLTRHSGDIDDQQNMLGEVKMRKAVHYLLVGICALTARPQ